MKQKVRVRPDGLIPQFRERMVLADLDPESMAGDTANIVVAGAELSGSFGENAAVQEECMEQPPSLGNELCIRCGDVVGHLLAHAARL